MSYNRRITDQYKNILDAAHLGDRKCIWSHNMAYKGVLQSLAIGTEVLEQIL